MSKIGVNEFCSCGSGKKYKRCCLETDQTRARATTPSLVFAAVDSESGWIVGYEDLDQASNAVLDLIRENRLDEAEAAARKLLEDYPDAVDGLERMGAVHDARHDDRRAAEMYQKALEFIGDDPSYDDAIRDYYRTKVAHHNKLASITTDCGREDK